MTNVPFQIKDQVTEEKEATVRQDRMDMDMANERSNRDQPNPLNTKKKKSAM